MSSAITTVKKVMRINGDMAYDGRDVNAFLDEGWILLHVYSRSVPRVHGPTDMVFYVLGWTLASDPPFMIYDVPSGP